MILSFIKKGGIHLFLCLIFSEKCTFVFMLRIIQKIYTFWCAFAVLSTFLSLFPFFWIFLQHKKTYFLAHLVNRTWAVLAFVGCGLFWKNTYVQKKHNSPVIYCANHTSYADIPLLFLGISEFFTIVGKAELTKIPLFGYMFKRLYIAVNRGSRRSKFETFHYAFKAIDEGKSVAFFPEGLIPDNNVPQMKSFKDGPFRIAIEKQIPIVPITIPYNWIILRDSSPLTARWHTAKAIYHDPIETKGMTLDDVKTLKENTFSIIHKELLKHQVI